MLDEVKKMSTLIILCMFDQDKQIPLKDVLTFNIHTTIILVILFLMWYSHSGF